MSKPPNAKKIPNVHFSLGEYYASKLIRDKNHKYVRVSSGRIYNKAGKPVKLSSIENRKEVKPVLPATKAVKDKIINNKRSLKGSNAGVKKLTLHVVPPPKSPKASTVGRNPGKPIRPTNPKGLVGLPRAGFDRFETSPSKLSNNIKLPSLPAMPPLPPRH